VITHEDLLNGTLKDIKYIKDSSPNGNINENKYIKEFCNVILGLSAIDEKGEFIMLRTKLLKEKKKTYQLTVEEQVKCIIEQSTDPDILGRAYFGWEPYI
jgi:hypothetical protein